MTVNLSIIALHHFVSAEMTTMFTFPYFLEDHVIVEIPEFKMLDYQVSFCAVECGHVIVM